MKGIANSSGNCYFRAKIFVLRRQEFDHKQSRFSASAMLMVVNLIVKTSFLIHFYIDFLFKIYI
jgi:hypothetical protein